METAISVLLGISLSAAAGFRVFVPPLVLSLLGRYSAWDLPSNLAWMASLPAVLLFAAATVVEVAAFYIPFVDNLLDTIAGPLAALAGVLLTGAFATDLDPAIRWSLALVAGGGAAAGVHLLSGATRLLSSGTTAGLGNPVVASGENVAATALSLLAVAVPVLAFALVVGLLVFAVRRVRRARSHRRTRVRGSGDGSPP